MAVQKMVKCPCGFEARGTEAELVKIVIDHGRKVHNMEVTREQAIAQMQPA